MSDDSDESVTKILGRVIKKSGESDKAVEKVLSEYRDNASAGRDYKALKAHLWSLIKQFLSKWWLYVMLALGGGATFRDSIENAILSFAN